jgi:hypothetical protein
MVRDVVVTLTLSLSLREREPFLARPSMVGPLSPRERDRVRVPSAP